jgi:K+-sensing histidine kinase KdpD
VIRDLIGRFEERLRDRASQVDMELSVELTEEQGAIPIHVDPSAVEQILFNLVDNACKYAIDAEEKTIHLRAERKGKNVEIGVSDHGPGIRGETRRSLFTAFSKSAHEAANSAPGVGLGLALSRRLARSMKGDLRYDDNHAEGARFVITFGIVGST